MSSLQKFRPDAAFQKSRISFFGGIAFFSSRAGENIQLVAIGENGRDVLRLPGVSTPAALRLLAAELEDTANEIEGEILADRAQAARNLYDRHTAERIAAAISSSGTVPSEECDVTVNIGCCYICGRSHDDDGYPVCSCTGGA